MKPKERMAIERVTMPELTPEYRVTHRKEEVNQSITLAMAQREAKRCLDCAKPTCTEGCPVNIDIPSFIKNIERGNIIGAARVLKTHHHYLLSVAVYVHRRSSVKADACI